MPAADDPVESAPVAPAPEGQASPTEPLGPQGKIAGDDHAARRRFSRLKDAAIEAEYATGRHEETQEEAKRHVLIRVGTIIVGFVVLIAGLAMLVLPGQGIITVIIGLTILARELPWAERLLEAAKKKAKLDELKQQPLWVKGVAWGFTLVAIGVSAWYVFFADPKPELTAALPWNWG
jgi:uncharacterized protein (TIGR02611 family)